MLSNLAAMLPFGPCVPHIQFGLWSSLPSGSEWVTLRISSCSQRCGTMFGTSFVSLSVAISGSKGREVIKEIACGRERMKEVKREPLLGLCGLLGKGFG